VFRAANLICQDVRAWNCTESAATAANWKLNELTVSSRRLLFAGMLSQPLDTPSERMATTIPVPLPRRLGPAETVLAYDHDLNRTENKNGSSESCRTVEKLCKKPEGFNPKTACVCSGQWRKAMPNTAEAPGPWKGSEGAYCHRWGFRSGAAEGPWCFVLLQQTCSNGTQGSYTDDRDNVFGISAEPCTKKVESRSQMMLDAVEAIHHTLQAAGLLGIACLLLACCGFAPALQPKPYKSSKPAKGFHHTTDAVDGGFPVKLEEKPFSLSLDERFKQAQRAAVESLSDHTPAEVKLLIYGYYKQATEGDATGKQPPSWNCREREKHDAWLRCWGLSREEAIEGYIQTVSMI